MGLRILKRSFVWLIPLLITLSPCYARPTLQRAPEDAAAGATADAERGMWVELSAGKKTLHAEELWVFSKALFSQSSSAPGLCSTSILPPQVIANGGGSSGRFGSGILASPCHHGTQNGFRVSATSERL